MLQVLRYGPADDLDSLAIIDKKEANDIRTFAMPAMAYVRNFKAD